jgi:8-oxo-dGTP pyrophosphatase MutT (NUDIX family)
MWSYDAAMEIAPFRPAVRIVCVDAAGRILLLRWQDPYDGSFLWEPPGGGIDEGETPAEAARRELIEETGLDAAAITGVELAVHRDTCWKGHRYVGPEQFFLARFDTEEPAVRRDGLLPYEQDELERHAWVPWQELRAIPDRLEPPTLPTVLRDLDPQGPWAGGTGPAGTGN